MALKSLNDLLIDSNPSIVKVVCNAIESLLKFEDMQRVADVFPYLIIFQSSSASKSAIYKPPTSKVFDLECIFNKHKLATHETWLKALVNELFQLFDDNNLSLVAAVHVSDSLSLSFLYNLLFDALTFSCRSLNACCLSLLKCC